MLEQKKTNKAVAASERKARAHNARLRAVLIFFISLCVAFSSGFMLSRNEKVLGALGVSSVLNKIVPKTGSSSDTGTAYSLSARISEVETILNDDSLDSYDLEKATDASLQAIADAASDPYLSYYPSNRYESLHASGDMKSTAGIGVLFSEQDARAVVVDVFDESAAQQSGVIEGDVVMALNGDHDADCSLVGVSSFLEKHEGEEVVITWQRSGTKEGKGKQEFTTTLSCSTYSVDNMTYELVDSVGYISLRQITQDSEKLVSRAVKELVGEDARAFVLDIRNNPGGYLSQTVGIASLFMESGTVVQVRTRSAGDAPRNVSGATLTNRPLVVLINGGTASSAEVLAAALQESGRALVVGESSLGRGSVQVLRDLTFGGALKYTAATYLTPQGHLIEGVGVSPDVSVARSVSSDNQKSIAIDAARSLIEE